MKRTLTFSNKAQMARAIAARFPELTRSLPPERRPWVSEHYRMAIFDAAAFGLSFFQVEEPRWDAGRCRFQRSFRTLSELPPPLRSHAEQWANQRAERAHRWVIPVAVIPVVAVVVGRS